MLNSTWVYEFTSLSADSAGLPPSWHHIMGLCPEEAAVSICMQELIHMSLLLDLLPLHSSHVLYVQGSVSPDSEGDHHRSSCWGGDWLWRDSGSCECSTLFSSCVLARKYILHFEDLVSKYIVSVCSVVMLSHTYCTVYSLWIQTRRAVGASSLPTITFYCRLTTTLGTAHTHTHIHTHTLHTQHGSSAGDCTLTSASSSNPPHIPGLHTVQVHVCTCSTCIATFIFCHHPLSSIKSIHVCTSDFLSSCVAWQFSCRNGSTKEEGGTLTSTLQTSGHLKDGNQKCNSKPSHTPIHVHHQTTTKRLNECFGSTLCPGSSGPG